METISLKAGNKISAFVTFLRLEPFESPIFAYAQPSEISGELDIITERIESVVTGEKEDWTKKIVEGDLCLALYDEDNTWYRGNIVSVHTQGNKLEVHFIDYGNTETIDITNTRPLPQSLRDTRPLAVKCHLIDFKYGIANDEEKTTLEEHFLNNEFELEVVTCNLPTDLEVYIFDKDSKKLTLNSFFEGKGSSNSDAKNNPEKSTAIELTSGLCYSAYISHVDEDPNCNKFSIQLVNDESYLEELMSKLSDYCGKNPPKLNNVTEGRICCTKFSEDDTWYRARIMKHNSPDGSVSVNFIDYGNSELKSISELYCLPKELAVVPSLSIPCVYDDSHHIPNITDKLHEVSEAGSVSCCVLAHLTDNIIKTCLKEIQDLSPVMVDSQFSPLILDIGTTVDCCISHVNGDGSFYIQLLKNAENLDSLMEIIEITECELPELCDPLVGCPCVCKLSDDAFYRCEIISTMDNIAEVKAVDFGFTESIKFSRVKAISGEIFDPTLFCIRCTLSDSKSKEVIPSSGHVSMLKSYEGAHPLVAKIVGQTQNDNCLTICLYDTKSSNDVNLAEKVLASAKIKSPVLSQNPTNQIVKIVLPQISVGSTISVCVTAIKSDKCFYGQIIKDSVEVIGQFQTDMNKFYDSVPSSALTSSDTGVGKFCVAKYAADGGWYRGVITEISNLHAEVMFIDFGDSERMVLKELKIVEKQFSMLPQQCIICQITPGDQLSKDLLEKTLVDKRIEVKVLSIGGACSPFSVELTDSFKNKAVKDSLFGNTKPGSFGGRPSGFQGRQSDTSSQGGFGASKERSFGQGSQGGFGASKERSFGQGSQGGFGASKERSFGQGPQGGFGASKERSFGQGSQGGFGASKERSFGQKDSQEEWDAPKEKTFGQKESFGKPSGFGGFGNDTTKQSGGFGESKPKDSAFQSGPGQQDRSTPKAGFGFGSNREKTFQSQDETSQKPSGGFGGGFSRDAPRGRDGKPSDGGGFKSRSSSSYQPLTITVPSTETIYIPHVESPDLFQCQLSRTSTQLKSLMENIGRHYSGLSIDDDRLTAVMLGEPCIAQYSADKQWYRAQITGILANSLVEVLFVDYGNNEVVPQSNLKIIQEEFLKLPIQCAQCGLTGVTPSQGFWSPEHIAQFEDLVLEQSFKATFNSKKTNESHYTVTLLDSGGNVINNKFGFSTSTACLTEEPGSNIRNVNAESKDLRIKLNSLRGGGQECDATGDGFGVSSYDAPVSKPRFGGGDSSERTSAFGGRTREIPQLPKSLSKTNDTWGDSGTENLSLCEKQASYKFMNLVSGEKLDVTVVYAMKPSEFYCQLIRYSSDLKSLVDDMNTEYDLLGKTELSITKLSNGMPCAAKFVDDETWYRGVIQNVATDSCNVKFVDYGNSENVAMGSLKRLKSEFLDLPVQAIKCGIANIKSSSDDWSDDAAADFEELTLDKHLVMKLLTISSDGSHIVELKDFTDSTDLALKLIELGHALSCSSVSGRFRGAAVAPNKSIVPHRGHESPTNVNKNPFKPLKIEPGLETQVFVSWTESPDSFWCQLADDPSGLEELVEAIQAHYTVGGGAKKLVKSAHIGMAVVAPYTEDDAWYRAYVEKIEDKLTVRFVDYGNTDSVERVSVREVSSDFIEIPAQAVKCCLPGLKPVQQGMWLKDAKDILEDLVKDGAYCKFISEEDGVFAVKLTVDEQNVAEELVKAAVAKKVDTSPPVSTQQARPVVPLADNRDNVNKLTESSTKPEKRSPQSLPLKLQTYQHPKPLSVGQTVSVVVAYCESINKVWCQLSSTTELDNLMEQLEHRYSSSTDDPHGTLLHMDVKHPCVAKYSVDQGWYRGEIITVKDTSCLIHFVDYGNTDDVNISDIRRIDEQFLSLPKQAFECTLTRLDDNLCPKEILENNVSEHELTLKVIKTGKVYEVELFIQNESVSEKILDEILPKSTEGSHHTECKLPERHISIGHKEMVYTVYIASPSEIYLHLTSLSAELDHITELLKTESSNPQPLHLPTDAKDIICCTKYVDDNCWYRAKIIDIKGQEVTVQFVDYGNTTVTKKDQLVSLNLKLVSIPPLAVKVHLFNLKPIGEKWTSGATEFLESLCVDKDLMCSFHSENAVELKLDQTDIAQQLIEAGHAMKRDCVKLETPSRVSVGESAETETYVIPKQTFTLGQTENVYISHSETPSKFYVQLTKLEDSLNDVTNLLQSIFGDESIATLKKPVVGQFCCAKYSEDESWYRAQVENITDTDITVSFIDFGNSETVDVRDLRHMTPTLLAPSFGVECTLSGISSIDGQTWTGDACSYFQELVMDKEIRCTFKGENLVELHISNESVADKLVSAGYAVKDEKTSQYPKQDIPLNEDIEAYISVIVNPNKFYIHFTKLSSELDHYVETLQEAYENSIVESISLLIGQPCVAKYSEDESWYRATIESINGENVTVLFVDFGNTETVTVDNIRKLSTEYSSKPPYAIPCNFTNLKPSADQWTPDVCSYFESLLSEEFICKFSSENSVKITVAGEDVSEKLIAEGHAVRSYEKLQPSNFPDPDILIGQEISAQVCHVESPSQFYIHLVDQKEKLDCLNEKLISPVKNCLPSIEDGCICLAFDNENNLWHRGRISDVNDGKTVAVYFVDSGKTKDCDISKLTVIDDELVLMPPFAIKCRLTFDCAKDWTTDDIRLFESLVIDKTLMCVFENSSEVRLMSDGKDVGEQLSSHSDLKEAAIQSDVNTYQESVPLPKTEEGREEFSKPENDVDSQSEDEIFENASDTLSPSVAENGTEGFETARTEFKRRNLVKGQRLKVTVTHSNSPGQFWIQLDSAKTQLNDMTEELYEYYNGLSEDEMTPMNFYNQMPCAVFYEDDESWYRGEVKRIGEENLEVLFVDYGNTETVDKSMTRTLLERFLELPSQVIECSLGGVKIHHGPWSDESAELFRELTSEKSLLADIVDVEADGVCRVHLLHLGISISDKLLSSTTEIEAATPVKLPQTVKRIFSDGDTATPVGSHSTNGLEVHDKTGICKTLIETEEDHRVYRQGEENILEVIVSHLTTPSDFWCQQVSEVDKIDQIANELTTNTALIPHNSVAVGDVCVAFAANKNKKLRAKIKSCEEESYLVEFIDYGISASVLNDELFQTPSEYSELPPQAIHCSLDVQPIRNSSSWCDEALSLFGDFVKDKTLKLNVINSKTPKWLVRLSSDDVNISTCLVEENVAEYSELLNDEFYDATEETDLNFTTDQSINTSELTSDMSQLETTTEEGSHDEKLNEENPVSKLKDGQVIDEKMEYLKESADTDTSFTEKTDDDAYKSADSDQTDGEEDELECSEDDTKPVPAIDDGDKDILLSTEPTETVIEKNVTEEASEEQIIKQESDLTETAGVVTDPSSVKEEINRDLVSERKEQITLKYSNESQQDNTERNTELVNIVEDNETDAKKEVNGSDDGDVLQKSEKEVALSVEITESEKDEERVEVKKPSFASTNQVRNITETTPDYSTVVPSQKPAASTKDPSDIDNEELSESINVDRSINISQMSEPISPIPDTTLDSSATLECSAMSLNYSIIDAGVGSVYNRLLIDCDTEALVTVVLGTDTQPNSFTMQLLSMKKQLSQLLDRIDDYTQNLEPDNEITFSVEDPCLVQDKDNVWQRGEIVDQTGDKYQVELVDYGEIIELEKEKIHSIPEDFIELPAQGILCKLTDCYPISGTWSKEALDYFGNYCAKKELMAYFHVLSCGCDDIYEVSLSSAEDKYAEMALSEEMVTKGLAQAFPGTHLEDVEEVDLTDEELEASFREVASLREDSFGDSVEEERKPSLVAINYSWRPGKPSILNDAEGVLQSKDLSVINEENESNKICKEESDCQEILESLLESVDKNIVCREEKKCIKELCVEQTKKIIENSLNAIEERATNDGADVDLTKTSMADVPNDERRDTERANSTETPVADVPDDEKGDKERVDSTQTLVADIPNDDKGDNELVDSAKTVADLPTEEKQDIECIYSRVTSVADVPNDERRDADSENGVESEMNQEFESEGENFNENSLPHTENNNKTENIEGCRYDVEKNVHGDKIQEMNGENETIPEYPVKEIPTSVLEAKEPSKCSLDKSETLDGSTAAEGDPES